MERTTNLAKLKNGATFTWGKVVQFFNIGPYTILQYNPWKAEGCEIFVDEPSDEFEYHVWIDEKDTSRGYHSLESAIVGAIAYKYDGTNSQAGEFFERMVGLKSCN